MLSTIRREGGLRDPEAAYHVQCLNAENGDVEAVEYDASDRPLRRYLVVHTDGHWAYSGPQRGMIECGGSEPSDAFRSATARAD